MRIRVRFFAGIREAVGRREVDLEVPEGTTADQALDRLVNAYPPLARFRASALVACNQAYTEGGRILAEGDEVALIPPVSGGGDCFEITELPISLDEVVRRVRLDTSGAVASFLGVVRVLSRGRTVQYLEYEAYPEMAVASMRAIGEEIRGRFAVDQVAILHRVGRLGIGEASVAIAVASPHRREALEACAHAIERLKAVVPIWKKEVWADGSAWIGSTVDEYRELAGDR